MLTLPNKLLFNALRPLVSGKVRKRCTFQINIAPPHYRGPGDADVAAEAFRTIIAPLLSASRECFVYGLDSSSELLALARPILSPLRGKHAIRIGTEAVAGYEALYAAAAGARGTILFRVPKENTILPGLFRHCYDPWYCENPGAGHTPSALQYAKRHIETSADVFLLLSRNSGLRCLDVVCSPPHNVHLFKQACWRATFRMTLWGE